MKKKSWAKACQYRSATRNLVKLKKFLKRQRAKQARKNPLKWKTTGAYDII